VARATWGDEDFAELLALRDELRRFLHWSEVQAQSVGLTDAQHQLLLAIRGHSVEGQAPTVGDVARHLMLRHHSAVELVQRAESAGLVKRIADPTDRRRVRLELSEAGVRALAKLTAAHVDELQLLRGSPEAPRERFEPTPPMVEEPVLEKPVVEKPVPERPVVAKPVVEEPVFDKPVVDQSAVEAPAPAPAPVVEPAAAPPRRIVVQCIHDHPASSQGWRVFVDRTWPHGVRADEAPIDEWLISVAPTHDLTQRHGTDPGTFLVFARHYRDELLERRKGELAQLVRYSIDGQLVLVTASSDTDRCAAAVLARVVSEHIVADHVFSEQRDVAT